MIKHFRVIAVSWFVLISGVLLFSQDMPSFGFGDPDSSGEGDTAAVSAGFSAPASPVRISGELAAEGIVYTEALRDADKRDTFDVGDLFSGVIDLSVTGKHADAFLSVEAENPDSGDSPFCIDEGYVRAYVGKADFEAGLRKLTWGRADSQGPLDVINPQDQSDLTVIEEMDRKIARPLVHFSYSLAPMTKIEAVYLPSFEGEQFASDGRWVPGVMTELESSLRQLLPVYSIPLSGVSRVEEDTDVLGNSQAGLRFTTTIGSVDFGAQYFYGYLRRPSVKVTLVPGSSLTVETLHNSFHQIGVDCATVLAGMNLRAELGTNLTDDFSGDDPSVYNPSVVWSLGFDRDVFAGINLNLQGSGSVRLMDDKVGTEAFDFEDDTDMTKTRITAIVSKKLFRDELELKTTALFGVEDQDYYIVPAAVWTRDEVAFELSAGFFGGKDSGELGCYDDNDYLKASVTVSF